MCTSNLEILLFILLIITSTFFTIGTLSFESIWRHKCVDSKAIKFHRLLWIFFMFLIGVMYGIYIIYPEKFYSNELVKKCLYLFTAGTIVYGIIGFILKLNMQNRRNKYGD